MIKRENIHNICTLLSINKRWARRDVVMKNVQFKA